MNPHKITLDIPIEFKGVKYSEITLRRPKVRDRLIIEKQSSSDAEKEVALIANLAEIEPEIIEELDLKDYAKIQKSLQDFLQ